MQAATRVGNPPTCAARHPQTPGSPDGVSRATLQHSNAVMKIVHHLSFLHLPNDPSSTPTVKIYSSHGGLRSAHLCDKTPPTNQPNVVNPVAPVSERPAAGSLYLCKLPPRSAHAHRTFQLFCVTSTILRGCAWRERAWGRGTISLQCEGHPEL